MTLNTAVSNLLFGVNLFIRLDYLLDNKHLLTGPKGNSDFCFPETLKWKQNSNFPSGQSLSVLLNLPTRNLEKTAKK